MDTNFKYLVVNSISDIYGGKGMTHQTAVVTKTDTMQHGSLLKADYTEALASEADQALYIIDHQSLNLRDTGTKHAVGLVKALCVVKADAMKFADAPYGGESLPLLTAKMITVI